MATVSK